jgi:hypothetical protein
MYRVNLAFVHLSNLVFMLNGLICPSSSRLTVLPLVLICIPSQVVYAFMRCSAITSLVIDATLLSSQSSSYSRYCQPGIKKRKTPVFLQGSVYCDVLLYRMTVQELAVSIILVLFHYIMRCRTGRVACTIPF